jgi:zinc transporter 1
VFISFYIAPDSNQSFTSEHSHSHAHPSSQPQSPVPSSPNSLLSGSTTPTQKKTTAIKIPHPRTRSPLRSSSTSSLSSDSPLYGHPVATRASLVQTANEIAWARSPSPPPLRREFSSIDSVAPQDNILNGSTTLEVSGPIPSEPRDNESTPLLSQRIRERSPDGNESAKHARHSHAHGSMNMRALVLHVIGDALGNVGVIATGLIIWFSTWKYKFYCDPIISLVITAIIFSSALPLGTFTQSYLIDLRT